MRRPLEPIVLIGAARSGTKILRDALAVAIDIPQVPYDVGYVWRYGNESCLHDALTPGDVRPRTRRLVEQFLGRYAENGRVIEKTVGNTLRVDFVATLLPEVRFVHVIRDGVDVVDSSRLQWETPPDASYLWAKARHFPLRLAPSYGRKFVTSAVRDRVRRERHAGTWGPRYPGIDEDLARDGLLSVTARQWRASVESARASLARTQRPVVELRYEMLVCDPHRALSLLAAGLGVQAARVDEAARMLHSGSPGRGRARLSLDEKDQIRPELDDLLKELHYDPV